MVYRSRINADGKYGLDQQQMMSTNSEISPSSTPFSSAGRAAAFGTLLGIMLKFFSFFLSQLTIRFVDPVVLGKASIRLDLLLSSVLFLGREGFRLALTRGDQSKDKNTKMSEDNGADNREATQPNESSGKEENIQITNVAWLSIPVGVLLSSIALAIHWYNCEQTRPPLSVEEIKHPESTYAELEDWQQEWNDYRIAGCLYCLSALIESLAEPLVILYAMRHLDVQTRAAAEASAALAKTIAIVVLLSPWCGSIRLPSYPVTIFGIGQLIHAIIFSSIFYSRKWNRISWPSLQPSSNSIVSGVKTSFHWPTMKLTALFAVQGIFKHALTEGDRIVLTAWTQGYDQGVYAMAQAYGGMASRLLLQPLEENARLLFSRQHRLIVEASSSRKSGRTDADITVTSIRVKKDLEQTLCVLVKLVLYIGLLFACLASNYTSILVRILAGSKWSSNSNAASVLSAFCIYTALLALNGMTEAFAYGVAQSGGEVGKLGLAHAVVGIIFAVTAPLLVGTHKTVGLVAANGLSMALRSAYSLYFAAGYFSSEGSGSSENVGRTRWAVITRLTRNMFPRTPVVFAFLVSFFTTKHSQKFYSDAVGLTSNGDGVSKAFIVSAAKHVGVGMLCALTTLAIAIQTEKQFRRSIMHLVRVKHD